MSDSVHIDGLKELDELLHNGTKRAAKRYIERCLQPAVDTVLAALDETVPVHFGDLKDSLTWEKGRWQSGDGESSLSVDVGPTKGFAWGSMQEFGTVNQKAQHWMGRAWEGCKDETLNVFVTECVGLLLDLENKS